MSGIDFVIQFYQLLNVPAITDLLNGGMVWRYQRPLNSNRLDVVISTPEYIGGSFNTAHVEINVHSPNVQNFSPYGIPDNTHPDIVKLRSVTDAILLLLSGRDIKVSGKVIQDKDGHWYSNIVVVVTEISIDMSTPVELWQSTSLSDGFGGSTAVLSKVWSGLGAMDNIRKDDQLEQNSGRYEMIMRCDWLIPSSEVVPQKNMELRTDEGGYVIRSIIPETGGDLWRITTVRKDAIRVH